MPKGIPKWKERLVVYLFITLGALMLLTIIGVPRGIIDGIVRNSSSWKEQKLREDISRFLSDDKLTEDDVFAQRVLDFIKSHPGDVLYRDAYETHPNHFLMYINKLEDTTIKKTMFDNIQVQNKLDYYINHYSSEYCGKIDKIFLKAYPKQFNEIKKHIANNLSDPSYLGQGLNFLSQNNLITKNTKEIFLDYITKVKDTLRISSELHSNQYALDRVKINLDTAISRSSKIINLTGLIVSQREPGIYSAMLANSDNVILRTYKRVYTSRVMFSIYAEKIGYVGVRLKEEYGGFTQLWPVYEEVDEKVKNTYQDEITLDKINIRDLEQIIRESKEYLITSKKKLYSITSKYNLKSLIMNGP